MRSIAILIPAALILAACAGLAAGPPPAPDLPPGVEWLADDWQAEVDTSRVSVQRRLQLSPGLSAVVRGSPELQPAALESAFRRAGAYWAECRLVDNLTAISIACNYAYALPPPDVFGAQSLPLPVDAPLAILSNLPLDTAYGVHLQTAGQATITGVFIILPTSQTEYYENGGYSLRRYTLDSLSRLAFIGETRLPPGSLPIALPPGPAAVFVQRYLPRPSAWLAFMFALPAALGALGFVFRPGARLPLRPALWAPAVHGWPRLVRWLAALIVRLVNWLRRQWPALFLRGLAAALAVTGIQLLLAAWSLARVYDNSDTLRLTLTRLLAALPLAGLVETLSWPGWPVVTALAGLGMAALAGGLLARRPAARVAAAGLCLGLMGGVILAWPHLLLAPPFLPFQLEALLVGGAGLLAAGALLARGLTHPYFRRFYQGDVR